jgi:hypothetical protein
MCCNLGEHFQQALNSTTPGIFQRIPSRKGKVTEIKQGQFFRSLCGNLKTRMLTTEAVHCFKTGNTEGECKYANLMKCLEVPDETKWPTDSDICFGDDPTRTLGKFFNMTTGIFQQCICAFHFGLS